MHGKACRRCCDSHVEVRKVPSEASTLSKPPYRRSHSQRKRFQRSQAPMYHPGSVDILVDQHLPREPAEHVHLARVKLKLTHGRR